MLPPMRNNQGISYRGVLEKIFKISRRETQFPETDLKQVFPGTGFGGK
jgi:hypothetical protein